MLSNQEYEAKIEELEARIEVLQTVIDVYSEYTGEEVLRFAPFDPKPSEGVYCLSPQNNLSAL